MKRLQLFPILLLLFIGTAPLLAQPNYTANDSVKVFTTPFAYGSNMGYFPPWDDEQLAEIAAGNPEKGIRGAGVKSLRPALPENFLERWGYDIRIETFEYYQTLGIRDNTIFIGYPSDEHRDSTFYCSERPSQLFGNMYSPIWDNGENGTPVNDTNYYALYLYEMVNRYGDFATTWEIWNEPDFDFVGHAWKPANMEDNWWTNNPEACDYAIQAPVQNYVRMLRISWEVIKTMRPQANIATGGFGHPSFLDAVLRNTDNPLNGTKNDAFPLKGGAYFDVMSFHVYPHVDGSMREWNNDAGRFDYERYSDAAMDGVVAKKKEFENVLKKYGYGVNLPQKEFIITECNIPRKSFGEAIGSDEAQRNFIIKSLVAVQQEQVRKFYVFNLGDSRSLAEAETEFHLMGMYKYLREDEPYEQVPNDIAIAYKTTSDLLFKSKYDKLQTQALLLPSGVRGAAFKHPKGDFTYVLWAKTETDLSELATQSYTFSPLIPADSLVVKAWDYGIDPEEELILGNRIQLTGSPVFIKAYVGENNAEIENPLEGPEEASIPFRVYPNPSTISTNIIFQLDQTRKVSLGIYDLSGQLIQEYHQREALESGVYAYELKDGIPAGIYVVKLEVDTVEYLRKILKVHGE